MYNIYRTVLLSVVVASISVTCLPANAPSSQIDKTTAINYLKKYKFMAPYNPDPRVAALTSSDALQMAIISFQNMYGLEPTGYLDEPTIKLMSKSRCGNSDVETEDDNNMSMGNKRRKKRFAHQGGKWPKTDLTYKFASYSARLSQTRIESEIQRAFAVWEMVTPLTFTKKSINDNVDITLLFATGAHNDGDPFDGSGNVLAHAYFPKYGGDAHFDDSENWTIDDVVGINLFQVAAHEFGHSLGLGHSNTMDALMAPFYSGYQSDFMLHQDDIDGIQGLYGRPVINTPKPTQAPVNPSVTTPILSTPDITTVCEAGKFDAVTQTEEDGEIKTYAFYNNLYMLLLDDGIAPGYPKQISEGWPGLEDNIDAAIYYRATYSTFWTWTARGWELTTEETSPARTYFFKGNQYWRADNGQMVNGYPRSIAKYWTGLPDDLDAAFIWSRNGRAYFVKGDQYYRFGKTRVDNGYPRPFSVWTEHFLSLDAAIQWQENTYFFTGTDYYRFDDQRIEIADGYPRSISEYWMGCERFTQAIVDDANNINSASHVKAAWVMISSIVLVLITMFL